MRHGENALLADYNKVDEWVDAVAKLISDVKFAQRISTQALIDVSNFTWINRAKVIIDAFT